MGITVQHQPPSRVVGSLAYRAGMAKEQASLRRQMTQIAARRAEADAQREFKEYMFERGLEAQEDEEKRRFDMFKKKLEFRKGLKEGERQEAFEWWKKRLGAKQAAELEMLEKKQDRRDRGGPDIGKVFLEQEELRNRKAMGRLNDLQAGELEWAAQGYERTYNDLINARAKIKDKLRKNTIRPEDAQRAILDISSQISDLVLDPDALKSTVSPREKFEAKQERAEQREEEKGNKLQRQVNKHFLRDTEDNIEDFVRTAKEKAKANEGSIVGDQVAVDNLDFFNAPTLSEYRKSVNDAREQLTNTELLNRPDEIVGEISNNINSLALSATDKYFNSDNWGKRLVGAVREYKGKQIAPENMPKRLLSDITEYLDVYHNEQWVGLLNHKRYGRKAGESADIYLKRIAPPLVELIDKFSDKLGNATASETIKTL